MIENVLDGAWSQNLVDDALLGILKLLNLLFTPQLLLLVLSFYRIVNLGRVLLDLLQISQLLLVEIAELELVEEAGGARP
jgi:hypothetical protein